MTMPVHISELTPRYGLQFLGHLESGLQKLIPLEKKLRLIRILQDSLVDYIEIGSFSHPKSVPQMKDTGDLANHLNPHNDRQFGALVPNVAGYKRFRQQENVNTAAVSVSASERHAQRDLNATVDQALARSEAVAIEAQQDGRYLRGHLACAFQEFGADFKRPSQLAIVKRLCKELMGFGCEMVSLADIGGMTTPPRVKEVLCELSKLEAVDIKSNISVAFHDGAGYGLACAYAAYELGVRNFDSSIGGLGGSRAAWNQSGLAGSVPTEHLVEMLSRIGAEIDVQKTDLHNAGQIVLEITEFLGEPQPSSILMPTWLRHAIKWVPLRDELTRPNHDEND